MVALNKEQRRKTTSFFFYLVNCPDDLSFFPDIGKKIPISGSMGGYGHISALRLKIKKIKALSFLQL